MSYVTELAENLRNSNISKDDRQAVLRGLQDLADTGNQEAKQTLKGFGPDDQHSDSEVDPIKSARSRRWF